MTSVLDDLLRQSKQLAQSLDQILHPDIPSLDLSLNELREKCLRIAKEDTGDRTKAHYLLAGSGINAESIDRDIESIRLQLQQEPTASIDTDVDAYLRHKREQNIIAVIEARKRQSQLDFQAFIEKNLDIDWQARKRKLLNSLGVTLPGSQTAGEARDGGSAKKQMNQSLFSRSVVKRQSAITSFEDIDLDGQNTESASAPWLAKAQTLAQAIASLNEHRLRQSPMAIFDMMARLTRTLGADVKTHQIADSWQLLCFLSKEAHVEHNQQSVGELFLPRVYANDYANLFHETLDMRRQFVVGARRYLECQFFTLIEKDIAKNPQEARLGGIPSVESKIKAYVNIRFSKFGKWTMPNLEIVNNAPVWAILFFMIRSGFLEQAVAYTLKNEQFFQKVEKSWSTYLKAYQTGNRRLPRQLKDRLQAEYDQRIKFVNEGSDPYKHALYKIIGRCDLNRKNLPEVLPMTEDWMWLQLSLTKETEADEPAYDQFSLNDLQSNILRFGPRHFNSKGSNPLLYFQMLLMSAQFERAVHYLCSYSFTDAVHFAIILVYYGLLRVTDDTSNTLMVCETDNQGPAIDFSSLITIYARQVSKHNALAAVDYLCLICLNSDDNRKSKALRNICHEAVRELVLETREFATLLGDVRSDGTREAGILEKRMKLLDMYNEKDFLHSITEHAAAQADQEGRTADAVLLYHLSEEFNTVVSIINKTLGEALTDPAYDASSSANSSSLSLSAAENPATLAKNMIVLYSGNAMIYSKVSQRNKENCEVLLKIADAKKLFASGQYEAALASVEQVGIIPLSEDMQIGAIKKRAQDFNALDESVAKNVASLLLMTVNCLKTIHTMLKQSSFSDQSRVAKMAILKKKAKNAVLFAGMIRYHMDQEVYIGLMAEEF